MLTVKAAREAIATAAADVDQWAAVVSDAAAELAAAQNVEPTSPADVAGVGQRVTAATATATAAGRGLVAARERCAQAYRDLLAVEADREDVAAGKVRAERDALVGKLAALTDQARELDGVDYGPRTIFTWDNRSITPTGRTATLTDQAAVHDVRATVARWIAEHGRRPAFMHDMGLPFLNGQALILPEHVPAACGEYLDAIAEPAPPEGEPGEPFAWVPYGSNGY